MALGPAVYAAKPPAHWLMVAEIEGRVLVVPLAPPDSGDTRRCRPIGCYVAAAHLAVRYSGGSMSPKTKMTRDEEHDYYSRPENQAPQGPARRRRSRLTEMVPVRFPPETLAEVHRCSGRGRPLGVELDSTGCRARARARAQRELVKQLVKQTTTDGPGRRRTARR